MRIGFTLPTPRKFSGVHVRPKLSGYNFPGRGGGIWLRACLHKFCAKFDGRHCFLRPYSVSRRPLAAARAGSWVLGVPGPAARTPLHHHPGGGCLLTDSGKFLFGKISFIFRSIFLLKIKRDIIHSSFHCALGARRRGCPGDSRKHPPLCVRNMRKSDTKCDVQQPYQTSFCR